MDAHLWNKQMLVVVKYEADQQNEQMKAVKKIKKKVTGETKETLKRETGKKEPRLYF